MVSQKNLHNTFCQEFDLCHQSTNRSMNRKRMRIMVQKSIIFLRNSGSKVIDNVAGSRAGSSHVNRASDAFQFDPTNYYPGNQPRSLSLLPMGSLFDQDRANFPMGKKRHINEVKETEVNLNILYVRWKN